MFPGSGIGAGCSYFHPRSALDGFRPELSALPCARRMLSSEEWLERGQLLGRIGEKEGGVKFGGLLGESFRRVTERYELVAGSPGLLLSRRYTVVLKCGSSGTRCSRVWKIWRSTCHQGLVDTLCVDGPRVMRVGVLHRVTILSKEGGPRRQTVKVSTGKDIGRWRRRRRALGVCLRISGCWCVWAIAPRRLMPTTARAGLLR